MIRLIIVLERPPAGLTYALQKGKSELVQRHDSTGDDLRFEVEVQSKGVDFAGPFVQGKKGERFLYIGIGTYAGGPPSQWSGRIKIPFAGIEPADGTAWQASFAGTAKNGSPACATLKPTSGWKRVILSACSTVADS